MSARILNITNGDSAANTMKHAGVVGEILPWRDCLHEGPVHNSLSLIELSALRAEFLARSFLLSESEIAADMQLRDFRASHISNYEQVILWFEHDLYDQLQLLQILDCLAKQVPSSTKLSMICINKFPNIDSFYGLGQLSPAEMYDLIGTGETITGDQLELGKDGWHAFGSSNPQDLIDFSKRDLTALPFLKPALIRLMQEYPSVDNGLTRTEQQALQSLRYGPKDPIAMFCLNQEMEEARYMGDASYWEIINNLIQGPVPLLKTVSGDKFRYPPPLTPDGSFKKQLIELTDEGRQVLECDLNRGECFDLDYWLGGVQIGQGERWCWDSSKNKLVNLEIDG